MNDQGWIFPDGSRKAHYFVNSRSLCLRWGFMTGQGEHDNDDSPDNCAECKRRLKKRIGLGPDPRPPATCLPAGRPATDYQPPGAKR